MQSMKNVVDVDDGVGVGSDRPTRPKFDAIFKNAIARNETDGQTDEDSALADSGNSENTSSVELLGAQRTWLRHQDHKKQV